MIEAYLREFRLMIVACICVITLSVNCSAQPNAADSSKAADSSSLPNIAKEDISFESMGVKLKGTLWRPAGEGPHPAIVCAHGSGKIDRNDSYIREFAEYFSQKGIAVFTYDKRGVGESGGEYQGSFGGSMVVYAADVISAVNDLKKRADIRKDQVGLFGVSQGGYIIPLAAAMDKRGVAFTIIVSGPVVSIAEENLYSNLTGDTDGKPTGKTKEEITKELKEYGSKGYDPYPFVEEMIRPGLWLYGELDKSVPVEESTANLEEIKTRWKRKFTIRVFPDADHGLKKTKTGNRWELPEPVETVDGYFETIEKWLADQAVIKNP
ncbi:MAG: prolyl oligopeptidase family serine peptidase [Pyrinomonadaceae bacterium]